MTERTRAYGSAYCQGESRRAPQSSDEGLGTKKTLMVLVIVVGCFAVLWPKLFYPMLVNNSHIKPGPVDKTSGCCDVISEVDVDTIKIMSELCGTIIEGGGETPLTPKEIVTQCRRALLETCGIDISAALQDRISLGHSAKQILEEVRSLNGSLCLKYNFGVAPWKLGVPHRININLDPINSIKQERPSHLRPGMVHPAFRERGRAIPESDGSVQPRRSAPPPKIVEGRPGPIPGMRPAMGGPGHVVAPSKQSNYGFMGVLMPIYTVGFVIFFSYTIMKLVFKKKPESHVGAPLYPPCDSDEQFHKEVFEANRYYFNRPNKDTSKIVVNAVAALLEEVNHEIEAHKPRTTPQADGSNAQDEIKANGSLPKEEEQGSVTVMAMETTASNESGKKWSRPDSPVLPHPPPKEPTPPPQQIFLEGALPPLSQILVADSAIETQKDPDEDDSPVVLAGKMTLSVISLDSETGTEDSSNSGRPADTPEEERGRSSSNTSDEFEKINAADLEDQINNIIEQAETIALAEETRSSLDDVVPQINLKESESDILEEIKNQFNLEDDLLQALREREPESQVGMPVTDIIKELLNNEGGILLSEPEPTDLSELLLGGLAGKEEDSIETEPKKEQPPEQLKEELIVLLDTSEPPVQEDKKEEEKDTSQPKEELIVLLDTSEPPVREDKKEEEKETSQPKELIVLLETSQTPVQEDKKEEEKELQLKEELIVLIDTDEEVKQQTEESPQPKEELNLDTTEPTSTHSPNKEEDTEPQPEVPKEEMILLLDTSELTTQEDSKEEEPRPDELTDVLEPTTNNELRDQKEELDNASTSEATKEEDAPQEPQPDQLDVEEQVIEDILYEDEDDNEDRRLNGEESSRNGTGNSETAAENDISEDELENEDEEIEEIIEYVDYTDEEGEEIIEINGNEQGHPN